MLSVSALLCTLVWANLTCCASVSPLLYLQDKGLSVGLLLMMQHLVELNTAKRAAAAAAAIPSKGKKGKKQAAAVPEDAVAATEDDQEDWLPELMASLCEKVGSAVVLRGTHSCLWLWSWLWF